MNRLFLCLLPIAFTSSVMACPNLTGKFTCKSEEGGEKYAIHILQDAQNIHWTVDGGEIQGPFPFDSEIKFDWLGNLLSYRIACEGDSLVLSGITQTFPQRTAVRLAMKRTADGLEIDQRDPMSYVSGLCKKVE